VEVGKDEIAFAVGLLTAGDTCAGVYNCYGGIGEDCPCGIGDSAVD
jgi:hypothetical protein